MKIKEVTYQNRRDFYAIYECEFCSHETKEQSGYDDSNFHNNVIPNMVCCKCNKKSEQATSTATNPDWMQY